MHRRTTWINNLPRWAVPAIGAVAAVLFAGGISAAVAASHQASVIACADGSDLLVHPGGTWSCATPAPSPSTLTESPQPSMSTSSTPSPSPSTSTTTAPSPTPTTTSPSPSPTTTTAGPGCATVPSACGFPDATNTGAKGDLAVVNGSVTLKTAGQVYENKDVRGCITVTAPGVTIRNVKVTCLSGTYAIRYSGGAPRLTVQDTSIDCGMRGSSSSGIGDRNFIAQRVNIRGCENGLDVDTEMTIEDSYIHDLYSGGGAHTDGMQIQATTGSGANIRVLHNTIDLERADATGNVFADHCQCTVFEVDRNLLKGDPSFPVYCPTNGVSTGVRVTNNRFAGNGGWGWSNNCGRAGYVWAGNVRDSTGKAVNP